MKNFIFFQKITLLIIFFFSLFTKTFAGTLLISHVLSNSLAFYEEESLNMLGEIYVGSNPHEVAVTPDGQTALVSNFGDVKGHFPGDTVTVVEIPTQKITKVIQLPKGARPHGFAVLSNSHALVTAQGIQSLLLIDFNSGQIIQTLPLPGAGAHMIVTDKNQQIAYVNNADSGSILQIDLKNFKVINEVKIGKEIMGLGLAPNGLLFAVDRKSDKLFVLNSSDLTLLKTIATDCQPVRVEIFNHGRSAVITNSLSGTAHIIDTNTLEIQKTFKTAPAPFSNIPINLFVNNDQRTAYITHYLGQISHIDLITGKILKNITSGVTADGVAVSPVMNPHSLTQSDSTFTSGALEINSSIDKVWTIVKDINHYDDFSQGIISASIDGDIAPGKQIEFKLYKNDPLGIIIPSSKELVTLVDEKLKMLTWVRKLPDGQYTSRTHFLQKISDNLTLSNIVLHIPGKIGAATHILLGERINEAFIRLNEGIKRESEMR